MCLALACAEMCVLEVCIIAYGKCYAFTSEFVPFSVIFLPAQVNKDLLDAFLAKKARGKQ